MYIVYKHRHHDTKKAYQTTKQIAEEAFSVVLGIKLWIINEFSKNCDNRKFTRKQFSHEYHDNFFPNSYAKNPMLLGIEAERRDLNAGAPKKYQVVKQK